MPPKFLNHGMNLSKSPAIIIPATCGNPNFLAVTAKYLVTIKIIPIESKICKMISVLEDDDIVKYLKLAKIE